MTSPKIFALTAVALAAHTLAFAQQSNETTLATTTVTASAEEELRQALGVSLITEEDLSKRPPANDISELVRTMPGVNLTGNSSSGQYGNNRQIDLRGMGPENTMILIDGRPVQSRNAVKMGRSGERDTRGDSNWVPVEAIERIEVIRGPAATRYGSGAAGGVVNIITKKTTDKLSGSVTIYNKFQDNALEGDSKRASFNLSTPVTDDVSLRLYGNITKTEADDPEINRAAAVAVNGTQLAPAGREGVRNRDINALIRWVLDNSQTIDFDIGVSRQGNIYTGETAVSSSAAIPSQLFGEETNTTHRNTLSITHRGKWDWGSSKIILQSEKTRRTQAQVGLGGSTEGGISSLDAKTTSTLENYFINAEATSPLKINGMQHIFTAGVEYRKESLDDPHANSAGTKVTNNSGQVVGDISSLFGGNSGARSGSASSDTFAFYIEDNFEPFTNLVLTPGLRFDHHSEAGNNWSPSLNASYQINDALQLKGGIARAFKAPNLYQANPNYLYSTMGNGCPVNSPNNTPGYGGGCMIVGNDNLSPETSINKEIGLAYNNLGLNASLTYFQNDYKNKIHADMDQQGPLLIQNPSDPTTSTQVFQWTNAKKAIIKGFEGNLTLPLDSNHGEDFKLITNFTYMLKNHNLSTNQPLSVIPKYTLNSTFDWRVSSQFSTQLHITHYGKQTPRTILTGGGNAQGDALTEIKPYSILGLAAQYKANKNLSFNFGITNLLDKKLYRADKGTAGGAATYNEVGRAYFVSATAKF